MDDLCKNINLEYRMVEEALSSEIGKNNITLYLTPLVRSVAIKYVHEYIVRKGLEMHSFDEKEFIRHGWKYLDFALDKYYKKEFDKQIKPYNFSLYFTWFIKQGVLDYLNSK